MWELGVGECGSGGFATSRWPVGRVGQWFQELAFLGASHQANSNANGKALRAWLVALLVRELCDLQNMI